MTDSSRQKAVNAARELFILKGKDGVRMQEIADHAGINKGLLHYYFKTKGALFAEVFSSIAGGIYSDINDILRSTASMDDKLSGIIDRYFELLKNNPKLPSFVMFEVNKHPDMVSLMAGNINLEETVTLLDEEFRANKVSSNREFALQVLFNIISLCIFPFMMQPLGSHLAERMGFGWKEMMEHRKAFLKQIIINSFKP